MWPNGCPCGPWARRRLALRAPSDPHQVLSASKHVRTQCRALQLERRSLRPPSPAAPGPPRRKSGCWAVLAARAADTLSRAQRCRPLISVPTRSPNNNQQPIDLLNAFTRLPPHLRANSTTRCHRETARRTVEAPIAAAITLWNTHSFVCRPFKSAKARDRSANRVKKPPRSHRRPPTTALPPSRPVSNP